ncbi:MAG: hypothetical protein ABWY57_16500 [Mycetocola sp.]
MGVGHPTYAAGGSGQVGRLGIVVVVAVLVAGCSSGSGSPSPAGGTAPYALRATTHQAIPPESQFTWMPYAFITDDGVVVTQGAVPAIFPGPLMPPLFGAPITEAGFGQVLERARALGLLDGDGDFSPPDPMPGALSGLIELKVDGTMREITGDPNSGIQCITTPCDPEPGTPEAFGTFWRELGDLRSMVGDQVGAEMAYHPEGYALLIGVTPPDDAGIEPHVVEWVLDTPLAEIGEPVGPDPLPTCGTVRGDDATTLEAAFSRSNQLTMWLDNSVSEPVSIAVRPLLPGDDPCNELFGIDA